MAWIADGLSWLLILLGAFLGLTGAVGMFRFPDFFTRTHAVGVTDTLTAACFLGALMVQGGLSLATLKLALIFFLLLFTSPTASHALAKAALHGGLGPGGPGPGGTGASPPAPIVPAEASGSAPDGEARP